MLKNLLIVQNLYQTQCSSRYYIFRSLINLATQLTFTLCIINKAKTKATQKSEYLSYSDNNQLHQVSKQYF